MHRYCSLFLYLTVLTSALILTGCSHARYPHILHEADRLTDTAPDSAVSMLASLEHRMIQEPQATQMYWRLLSVKAQDKAYKPQCTPGQIEEIANYYIAGGDKELLPEALYYAGRVYRTHNDAPQARGYFLKAIEAIDASETPDDYAALKGKCLSQIGSVYLYQDLCAEAINMYQRALDINHESRDTIGMIFNLRDVANVYLSMSKPDSSLIYSNRGINLASNISDSLFLNELYLLRAAAHIEQGKYRTASEDFSTAETYSPEANSITQYTIAARLAEATGDTALCRKMSRIMLDEGNLHDQRWAAKTLASLELKSNKPHLADSLLNLYIALDDSVSNIDRAQTILKLNAMYDYSIRENENIRLKSHNTKLVWMFGVAAALLALLAASAIFYLRYKRQQHALLKLKIEKLETLRKESQTKDSVLAKNETDSLKASDIYQKICRNINSPQGPTRLTDREWLEAAEIIKTIHPQFEERLLSLCRMNDNEMKVCLLLKMEFTPSVIAGLTCHSKESVSATRRRLFEKAFGQKRPPRDWDDFIRTL